MREKVSVLMDAELDGEEAANLLSGMSGEEKDDWLLYHMIGDAVRDPEGFRAYLDLDCCEAIDAEPTVLAPPPGRLHKVKLYAFSVAASLAAVALVGWVALQSPADSPVPKQVARHLDVIKSRLNDYLLAHQEFSPGAEMMTPNNIRTVSDSIQESGR